MDSHSHSHIHTHLHHHEHSHNHHKASSKNIFIAFVLNFVFSIFEIIGGIITGSVAIISDAIHDFGDAISIGVSYYLEKKSKKKADENYTYGYGRFSVLGALITNLILIFGSIVVITNAIHRFVVPQEINYDGMILFAIVGTIVNLIATFVTSGGNSLNEKAVNLHMLEDVLGWIVVLIGAIIIKLTSWYFIDAVLSILVSIFILYNAIGFVITVVKIFLEKVPDEINISEIRKNILSIHNVEKIQSLHIWSIDGIEHCATIHVIVHNSNQDIKDNILKIFKKNKIVHYTIEMEDINI